jgi:nitroreductase
MRFLMTALGLAVLSTAALAPFHANAQAQTAVVVDDREQRLALADQYLAITMSEDMFSAMNEEIRRSFEESEGVPAAERAWLVANFTPMMADVMAKTIADVRGPVADLFTAEELEAMIAFNSTPMGASIARKSVRFGTDIQTAMTPHLMTAMTSLMEKYCTRFDCGSGASGAAAAKSGR